MIAALAAAEQLAVIVGAGLAGGVLLCALLAAAVSRPRPRRKR